jgi:hypothetical protein
MIMTRNKAQKTATRQRMAETGEPYSVARRAIRAGNAGPADPDFIEMTPEEQYVREAETAGITAAEVEAQKAAFRAQEAADQAEERAERAQEAADLVQERADEAQERAADGPGRTRQRRPGMTPPPLPPLPPLPPFPPQAPQPPR